MAERSRQRGFKRVGVTGSEVFRRRMWFELSLRGISAVGYEPTQDDKNRLKWWMNEQAANGRGADPAGTPESDGRDDIGADHATGCDAPGESFHERRAGGGDVPLAPGHDIAGDGKSDIAQGNALADAQRNPTNEGGDGRDAGVDDGSQGSTHGLEVEPGELSPELQPGPHLRRATRLGAAALLRQGVQLAAESDDLRASLDMLWELERRFIHWRITCDKPGEGLLAELARSDQLSPNWANLQVLNSQGCNVQLSLTSKASWLHLVGVTEGDLEHLLIQGIVPTIQMTVAGMTEVFVHVNYGCENRQVMARLAEQIQIGLEATVHAHIGSVSFPLPGFDRWDEEAPRVCCGLKFDSASMGAQLSSQLRQLKGEVGPPRVLGAIPILRSEEKEEEQLVGRLRAQPELPIPEL
ncbi:hypothetical protein D9M70_420770 [compost metagenome]